MPDDPKPELVPFEIDVKVDRVRVRITLMLKSGTVVEPGSTVSVETKPEPSD